MGMKNLPQTQQYPLDEDSIRSRDPDELVDYFKRLIKQEKSIYDDIVRVVNGNASVYNNNPYGDMAPPVGCVIPWIGGYFTNGSNGGYTPVLGAGNTIPAVNALLNSSGWYVCDGSALNDASSPIFNGAGRYLPNLTDSRFLSGSTAAGAIGGSNTMVDHTHTFSLTAAGQSYSGNSGSVSISASDGGHSHSVYDPSHSHGLYDPQHNHWVGCNYHGAGNFTSGDMWWAGYSPWGPTTFDSITNASIYANGTSVSLYTGYASISASGTVSISHTHSSSSVSGSVGSGSGAASTDNRPKYLSVFYITRIK